MAKEWAGAPFGSQSDRFNVKGLHPNMFSKTGHIPYESAFITPAVLEYFYLSIRLMCVFLFLLIVLVFSKTKNVGPGSYNLLLYGDFSEKSLHKKASGPNWEKSLYNEKLAKMPHLLFREQFAERKDLV
jgi:hypothetical protein